MGDADLRPETLRTLFQRSCERVSAALPARLRLVIPPSVVGFGAINGFTFALDVLLLSVLVRGTDLALWAAISIAYGTALSLSFLLNRTLNFTSERGLGIEVGRYVAVAVVNYVSIVLGVTYVLTLVGAPESLARVGSGVTEAAYMYCAMRWLVFGRTRRGSRAPVLIASQVVPCPWSRGLGRGVGVRQALSVRRQQEGGCGDGPSSGLA